MVFNVKPILQAGVALQAVGLLGENIKVAKKPSTKGIIKAGVTNIVGVPLLQIQSQLIGGL